MRNGLKTLLFVGAFSPALITLGAARLIADGVSVGAFAYMAAGTLGSSSAFYILSLLKRQGEVFPFRAKKVESNDALLLGVAVTYILPFFVRAPDITIGIVAAIIACGWILFWFTDTTAPIPLLRLTGLRFYKVEAANGMVYTLITDREIKDPANVRAVKKISGSMLLEVTP